MASGQANRQQQRRCLIVERHDWETGGRQQQLQFLLGLARQFFGGGGVDRQVQLRVYQPLTSPQPTRNTTITISREYANGTRRTNRFPMMSRIPSSFVFFQETVTPGTYDFWWQTDKAIVAAKYAGWSQGPNTQYGRGRLSIIVPGPVPRPINRI